MAHTGIAKHDPMDTLEEQSHTFLINSPDVMRFYNWVFENVRPYMHGRSIEINSGKGLFSNLLTNKYIPIHLSDPVRANRDNLRAKFAEIVYMRAVHSIDIYNSEIRLSNPDLIDVFDTLFAINVLEYGYFTKSGIENLQQLLKPEGNLIIIVPAFTALYTGLEENVSDWKRFNQKALIKLLSKRFSILKTRYLNLLQSGTGQNVTRELGLSILAVLKRNR